MDLKTNLPEQIIRNCHDSKTNAKDEIENKQADFEEAISAAGYGKFHYLLYLAIIPISWASVLDTSTASMVVPAAECDLDLTLLRKGVLNAVVYAGMISSAFLWGFIADTFGRKPLVFYGYLLDAILNLFSGLSQNFYVLAAFKFACGFIVSGPYASVMTYCAEFHKPRDRPKITMWIGFFMSLGSIIGAALALLIIPQELSLSLGFIRIHSWHIYLAVCSLPVFFGVFCIGFFPESPKFLMSQGRNEEALQVFRQIHKTNSKGGQKTYPVEALKSETPLQTISDEKRMNVEINKQESDPKSLRLRIREGLCQMKPLISDSYFFKLMLIITIQFCGMSSMNTIRLWQPQLFSMLTEPTEESYPIEGVPFCEIIDHSIFVKTNESMKTMSFNGSELECVRKPVDGFVYMNTIIISTGVLVFALLGGLMSGIMNPKYFLLMCYSVSACCVLALNWSNNIILTLILISVFLGCMSVSINLVISVVVNLFPTSVRTMAVSVTMMCGRIGSLLGNTLFPVFLGYGCTFAVMMVTILTLVALVLTLFVPKCEDKE